MHLARFERIALESGFEIESREELDARESGDLGERNKEGLLRAARMRRDRECIERELGPEMYAYALSGYRWGAYQLLGKLTPMAHVLRRA